MTRILLRLHSACLALVLSTAAHAQCTSADCRQDASMDSPSPRVLDTITVTGSAPGPGMWHVINGDNEMWILGTLAPAPASITWNSELVKGLLSDTKEVLWEPYYQVDVKAGFFQKLLLAYGMSKASKNPDGKTLKDVLPPPLYARWLQAKALYLPKDDSVEDKRPLLAANDLFNAATAHFGLSNGSLVNGPVLESIKTHGITSVVPAVVVPLETADAKAMLKSLRHASLNDISCMEATLDAIDHDMPRMITNANAWAKGDLANISFSELKRRDRACADAFTDNDAAQQNGLPNIAASIGARWMEEAESALRRNRSTVAIAPLENVTGADGYAAKLAAKGYEVIAP